jgi:hypothetical protein
MTQSGLTLKNAVSASLLLLSCAVVAVAVVVETISDAKRAELADYLKDEYEADSVVVFPGEKLAEITICDVTNIYLVEKTLEGATLVSYSDHVPTLFKRTHFETSNIEP